MSTPQNIPSPPHDVGAERALLGSALSNVHALGWAAEHLQAEEFYLPSHARIFEVLRDMASRDASADVLTACAELERKGELDEVGGIDYMHHLIDCVVVAANAPAYGQQIKDKACQRDVLRALQNAEHLALAPEFLGEGRRALHQELQVLTDRLVEGSTQDSSALRVYDGIELADMEQADPEVICEGLVYRGCSTDFVAGPKRGKTTLALSVARAIVAGEPWCGRETRQSPVLYLSEQSAYSFVPQCRRAGLSGLEGFKFVLHDDARLLDWATTAENVIREAARAGIHVVFVDNLSLWAGVEGDEENSAGAALEILRSVDRMTSAGLAVVAIRHARKGGGAINEAGRGSSAIAGGFDILARLEGDRNRPRRRILATTGRVFPEEPAPLVVELDEDGVFRLVGEGRRRSEDETRHLVLGLVPAGRDHAVPEPELIARARQAGMGKSALQEVLREIERDGRHGLMRAKGAGAASSRAYGYWLEAALDSDG